MIAIDRPGMATAAVMTTGMTDTAARGSPFAELITAIRSTLTVAVTCAAPSGSADDTRQSAVSMHRRGSLTRSHYRRVKLHV